MHAKLQQQESSAHTIGAEARNRILAQPLRRISLSGWNSLSLHNLMSGVFERDLRHRGPK
jgi:hypothetical protein